MNKNWLPLLCVLALVGCVETKDEFTLNPDGTGKVKHEAVFQTVNLNFDESKEKPSPEEEMKSAVRAELEKSEGVEAWRDVTFERTKDGRIRFAGTAYFRDLAKLKLHNNGFKANMFKPTWANGILEMATDRKQTVNKKPLPQTDAEVDKAIADARAEFQRMKPMMTGLLGTLKADMSFRLPGTVTESSNLKREADGALRLQFSGAQMLEILDKFMGDEAKLREEIKAGRDPIKTGPESDLMLNQQLLGEAKPVRAVVNLDAKPQFDFAGEVAAAKAQMPAIFKALGGTAPAIVVPGGSAELKGTTVGGVRWVRVEDREREIRPFNWPAGYTLVVIAELPGTVLKATGGELTTAETDNGEDLLPAKEWDRKIHFPKLSKDGTVAIFEVGLKSPSDAAKGFKEIAGRITYLVGEKTKKTELGFAELADGAQGKELGAVIKSIQPSQWSKGTTDMDLKLAVKREVVKAVEVLDAAGKPIETAINGHMGGNDQVTLTLNLKAALPKDGKIVVELFEDLKQFDAPFSLKNISLLGQPLK